MSKVEKLYFYYLDEYGENSVFRVVEIEAIEQGGSYLPVNESTRFPLTPIVHKNLLGHLHGYDVKRVLVLKEPDLEYAKRLFKECFEKNVKHYKDMVALWEERISIIESTKEVDKDEKKSD